MLNCTATRCRCGAITVRIGQEFYQMRLSTFKSLLPGLLITADTVFSSCDHCANHWGVDICPCGSGKAVGDCNQKTPSCRDVPVLPHLLAMTADHHRVSRICSRLFGGLGRASDFNSSVVKVHPQNQEVLTHEPARL